MEWRGWLGATGTTYGSEGDSEHQLRDGELLNTKIIVHLQKGWKWVAVVKMVADAVNGLSGPWMMLRTRVHSVMCSQRLRRSSAICL